jgi:phospholipid transport system substrate-binding protein
MTKTFAIALLAAASTVIAAPAFAQSSDPAGKTIEAFDAALIKTLQAGKAAGTAGRAKVIGPAVEQAFALDVMVRTAIGPDWTKMSSDDQATLGAAYKKFAIANYAKNFDNYSGQKLELDGPVQDRGADKLVKTKLTGGGSNVTLAYRMRDTGSGWKVIDVFYNGSISQLATQRSDFASSLASGGAKALITKLDAQTDKLLK